AVNDHRPVKRFGNQCFFVSAEIRSPVNLDSLALQQCNGFAVADAREWLFDVRQFAHVALQRCQFSVAVGKYTLNNVFDKILSQVHVAVEIAVGDLWLDHPELSEMATGLRFLRPEGWAEAVDLAEGHSSSFHIK